MDPFTLLALLSGALGAGAVVTEISYRKTANQPILIRTVWKSRPGDAEMWEANELLSEAALTEVGQIFDVDMGTWWPKVSTGFYRAFVLAEVGAPMNRHVVFRTALNGRTWELDVAYGICQAKVKEHQYARINAVLHALNSRSGASVGPFLPGDALVKKWSDGWGIVRLGSKLAIEMHSNEMDHSLDWLMDQYDKSGRPAYAYKVMAPTSEGGQAVATFVVEPADGGGVCVTESHGRDGAGSPPEADARVSEFITQINAGGLPAACPTPMLKLADKPPEDWEAPSTDEMVFLSPGVRSDEPEEKFGTYRW